MRSTILMGLLVVSLVSIQLTPSGQAPAKQATPMRPNMTGSYGPWLADEVLGDGPARLSFRTGKYKNLNAWRKVARQRVLETMAPVNLGGKARGQSRVRGYL